MQAARANLPFAAAHSEIEAVRTTELSISVLYYMSECKCFGMRQCNKVLQCGKVKKIANFALQRDCLTSTGTCFNR